ncbi:MAG: hypothetical protein ACT4O0_17805 [Pseudonocardia sp.]
MVVVNRIVAARGVVVAAVLASSWFLVPRVLDLVRLPDVLDEAVGHARSYNGLLPETAAFDERATAELAALDRVEAALARTRSTNEQVATELRATVTAIRAEALPLLGQTNIEIAALVGSLDRLHDELAALPEPLHDAATAVADGRHGLDHALRTARQIAQQVRAARESAARAADNVSEPAR